MGSASLTAHSRSYVSHGSQQRATRGPIDLSLRVSAAAGDAIATAVVNATTILSWIVSRPYVQPQQCAVYVLGA